MSRIAVVMPAYNAERFVARAIESVLNQSHRDWSLHVVDDGSVDRTYSIACQIARADSRVTVTTAPNAGIANVMNRAIANADSDLVACMHADDLMLPNRLERQAAFANEYPDVAVFSSYVQWIDQAGRPLGQSRSELTTVEAVRRKIAAGGCVAFPHPAVLFRKSVIHGVGGYRQEFFPAEDTELWNRVAFAGHGVLVQPEVLLQYRLHAASASMSQSATMIRRLRWIEACVDAWRHGSSEPTYEQFWSRRRMLGPASRFRETRKDCSRILYQMAIGHYAARRYVSLVPLAFASAVLEPKLALYRVMAHSVRLLCGANSVVRSR